MPVKPSIKLNNGLDMPALGFGTFANDLIPGQTHLAVVAALKAGYRHLDCAWIYENEAEVGTGLQEFLFENPEVKRSDIFIVTKVWPHLLEPDDVEWSLNDSLKKLGTDYIDLFLIHWPFAAEKTEDYDVKLGPDGKYLIKKDLTENLEPSWRAMEKLYKSGKTKAIGVSNWTIPGLKTLLKYAEVKPVCNQVEIHPYFPNTELIEYCFSHQVTPVAYSPLGAQEGTGERLLVNKELNALASKRGFTLAQLLIAWGLRRGYAVLPKSTNESRIKSNAELVKLSDEDFDAVNKITEGRNHRFVTCVDQDFGYDVWAEESK